MILSLTFSSNQKAFFTLKCMSTFVFIADEENAITEHKLVNWLSMEKWGVKPLLELCPPEPPLFA